jgi:hypothetical protein
VDPIAVLVAAEDALVLEEEVDDDDVEVLLLEGEAIRLVAACIADDILLPELEDEELAFDFDALDVTVIDGLVDVEAEVELSRPRSEWLPRRDGDMREAKFSAAVTPVSRTVTSSGPDVTLAVRTAEAGVDFACSEADRRAKTQYAPTPAMSKTMRAGIHQRRE